MSPMKSLQPVHRVLIVEDDPAARAILEELVRSRGDSPRAVGTVEEAMRALVEELFCYVLLDQQLPSVEGAEPMLGGGERILVAIRKLDGRRNAEGFHVTPVIVLTGYSSNPDFVSKMYDLGASGFIAKPLPPNLEKLLDRIRTCLARGGRGEHEGCAGLGGVGAPVAEGGPAVGGKGAVTLAVDDGIVGAATAVRVCGELRPMQFSKFVVMLRLIAVHGRGNGSWESSDELGFGDNRAVTTAIRKVFAGLIPPGFEVLERDGLGQFRLNPRIVVGPVNWDALAAHPDGSVRNIALKARKGVVRA